MAYNYSELDNKNLKWFPNDTSRATLLSIRVAVGKVRGLENIQVDFNYPITAIAGRNGSGKTTLLALAACAFHNTRKGFRLIGRKNSYYTFSDFFIQTSEELSVAGIGIQYRILHNKWYSPKNPAGRIGPGLQSRRKRYGGRWSNYDSRVKRTVVYLGIDRIVPDAERSVSKSYRRLFQPVNAQGWEDDVRTIVGRILSTDYEYFGHKQHSKYRIPLVKSGKTTYSGFNMGAGEESLFELFSITKECPDGSLIVIDEIELGLHEDAQARLIYELKALCEQRKFQIICTTHSPRILECLPPEGRIYLDRVGDTIHVLPGISSAYATGKLSGRPLAELDVLVEDNSAKLIVEACLTPELRSRIKALPVGSSAAVMRHMAAKYKENRPPEVCVILDGDKLPSAKGQIKEFLNALEGTKDQAEAQQWAEKRLNFLPGAEWPELWVIGQKNEVVCERLGEEFSLSPEKVIELLNGARRAGKHNEFHEAATMLNLDKIIVAHQLIRAAFEAAPDEQKRLTNFIESFLK
jgi:predicted ATPase